MRQQLDRLVRTNQPPNLAACGYQKLAVTDAAIVMLTVPTGTKYCEIVVESATTTGFVVNTLNYQNATPATLPSVTDGIPFAHGTMFDISQVDSIANFRAICRTGLTCSLHIQYYK
jgi:hypothetical protein